MFDIGWGEMLVIAIVVIVVVGPKELPGMLRTFGRTTSKLRVMANDFRKQFDEALKEAELDDLKKVADDVRSLNPARDIKKALSPMEKAAQDVRAGLDSALKPTPKPTPAPASTEAVAAEPAKAGATALPGETAKPVTKAKGAAAPAKAKAASAPKAAAKPAAPAKAKPAASKPSAAKPKSAPKTAKSGNGGASS